MARVSLDGRCVDGRYNKLIIYNRPSCFKTLQFDIMNVQKWIEFQCGKNQDGRCVGKK